MKTLLLFFMGFVSWSLASPINIQFGYDSRTTNDDNQWILQNLRLNLPLDDSDEEDDSDSDTINLLQSFIRSLSNGSTSAKSNTNILITLGSAQNQSTKGSTSGSEKPRTGLKGLYYKLKYSDGQSSDVNIYTSLEFLEYLLTYTPNIGDILKQYRSKTIQVLSEDLSRAVIDAILGDDTKSINILKELEKFVVNLGNASATTNSSTNFVIKLGSTQDQSSNGSTATSGKATTGLKGLFNRLQNSFEESEDMEDYNYTPLEFLQYFVFNIYYIGDDSDRPKSIEEIFDDLNRELTGDKIGKLSKDVLDIILGYVQDTLKDDSDEGSSDDDKASFDTNTLKLLSDFLLNLANGSISTKLSADILIMLGANQNQSSNGSTATSGKSTTGLKGLLNKLNDPEYQESTENGPDTDDSAELLEPIDISGVLTRDRPLGLPLMLNV